MKNKKKKSNVKVDKSTMLNALKTDSDTFILSKGDYKIILEKSIEENNLLEASVHLLLDQLLKGQPVIDLRGVGHSGNMTWLNISNDGLTYGPPESVHLSGSKWHRQMKLSEISLKTKLEILKGVKFKPAKAKKK